MFLFTKKRKEQKGFTLIEVMLVVAMIAMLAGMTIPITFGSLKKQSVEEESSKLLSVLRQTQAKSMKGRGDSPWGVYFTPESYTVFKGNSYEERESIYDEVFEISPGMSVAGAPEIVFDYEGIPRIGGLVGHWTMNEGEGGVVHDLSGHENHGTLVNDPTWANGKVGGALDFDGTDDYSSVNTNSKIKLENEFSASFWVYRFGNSQTYEFFLGVDDAPGTGGLPKIGFISSDGSGFVRVYRGSDSASFPAVDLGSWNFVTIRRNSDNKIDYFLNNNSPFRMFGDVAQAGDFYVNRIGIDEGGWPFNGLIDDVRIYDRALTAEEIRLMYESGLEGVDDNIIELSGSGESVKINIGRQGRIEIVR